MDNTFYQLLDSGNQLKWERFGPHSLVRPCSQALWRPQLKCWDQADGTFSREQGKGWAWKRQAPMPWTCTLNNVRFKISPTDFGHLGVFPEHAVFWDEMRGLLRQRPQPSVLNLFAYSGGATLAAAQAGAKVCHVDASHPMVLWARENAALNDLTQAPIRWIVDDVFKFLKREVRRGVRYDGIILDPPTFGRGTKGEVFKLEDEIQELLGLSASLLSDNPLFVFFTTHTPGITPLVLQHLLQQHFPKNVTGGELQIVHPEGRHLPSGTYAKWVHG